MAVPHEKNSAAYRRLRRVWFDHTRFSGSPLEKSNRKDYEIKRHHEFQKPHHETNLTVGFWENFLIFPAEKWLPILYRKAGISFEADTRLKCRWSYEWEGYRPSAGGGHGSEQGMCDVVVEYRNEDGDGGILVVESKSLNKCIGEKELNFDYYLSIRDFEPYGKNTALIYLVDESVRSKSLELLGNLPANVGLITWQQLAGIQIELAQTLEVPVDIQNFIAGAIQFQFSQHDIGPEKLSASYLTDEPGFFEMDALPRGAKQKMADHQVPLWRLD